MKFEMPDSYEQSSFLDKPGQYHVAVDRVEENPISKGGKMLEGIRVHFQVLSGTETSQVKRTHNELIFFPSLDSKDQGEFARKKLGRMIRALFLHDTATGQLAEKCKAADINWEEARGRQMIVWIVSQEDDPKYVQVQGAHFYKVNDPEVAHVPKCEKSLKLLAASANAAPAAAQPVNRTATAAAPAPQPAGASVNGSSDNWDELFR